MAPNLSEDDIDDLLYFARTGEKPEFDALKAELCSREKISVAELLENARDEESGNGPLHMAAANGHHGLLQEVCKALSNPTPQNPAMLAILNRQNKAGNTALHWAALNGHLESVKVLLDAGSDPTITNQRGHDAVYEAEINDQKEVVDWVLKEGGEGLEEGVSGESVEGDSQDVADEEMDLGEDDISGKGESSKKLEEHLDHMDINKDNLNT